MQSKENQRLLLQGIKNIVVYYNTRRRLTGVATKDYSDEIFTEISRNLKYICDTYQYATIKTSSNSLVLENKGTVVKVTKKNKSLLTLETLEKLSLWFNLLKISTPRLDESLDLGEVIVTVWEKVERNGNPRWGELGVYLTKLHNANLTNDISLPSFLDIARRWDTRAEFYDKEIPKLHEVWWVLRGSLEIVEAGTKISKIIHGDLNIGNILWGNVGVQLCDLENMAQGPLEWDLAKLYNDLTRKKIKEKNFKIVTENYHNHINWELFTRLVKLDALREHTWVLSEIDSPSGVGGMKQRREATVRSIQSMIQNYA